MAKDRWSQEEEPPARLLYSLEEAAELLGVSKKTLAREIAARKLSHVRVGGRPKFRMLDINEYIERHAVPAARPNADSTRKEATVQRYHYETHDQLRRHLADFVTAYNFVRRLKSLEGLTPYECVCKAWAKEPNRFTLDPTHQMPGLNTYCATAAARLRSMLWYSFRTRSKPLA
jgi:excisionase family DNA binding protein